MFPETNNVSQTTVAKIGKFKASKMIVSESWNILKQDKELAWFPVMSFIVSLITLLVFAAVVFFVVLSGNINSVMDFSSSGGEAWGYIILFVYYTLIFFVTNYFLAAMYIIINGRFKGQNLSISDGLGGANKILGKIFVWSLISATVGVILRIISDKSKIIGKIVSALLGAAWSIMTYFSLPSLVIGGSSIKDSFRDSASIIRKTWGEAIIINFGVGLFFFLLTVVALLISLIIVIISPTTIVVISVGVLFLLYIIAITIISSTLGSIFKLALYEYGKNGTIPTGFTPELITGAIKKK